MAKHIGATVIGVVSNEEKAALAGAHGAAHNVIGHATLVQEVKRIIGAAMVPAVYDTVRKDTFNASLDSLAPPGLKFAASSCWYGGGIPGTKNESPNRPGQMGVGEKDASNPMNGVAAVRAAQPKVEV